MRLPASYIQINAMHERKLAELFSFVQEHVPNVPTDGHWFWTTYEIVGRALLHKRYDHMNKLWFRGIERQTQHPIDFLHDFKTEYVRDKKQLFLTVPTLEDMNVVLYDETKGQAILQMFDYCQGISPIFSTKNVITFDENGRVPGTPFDWYQLLFNYVVPVLLYDKAYCCQAHTELEPNKHFGWTCRMVYSLRTEDPVTFVKSLYDKRVNGVPFYDKMEDYLKAVHRHEKSKKEKSKSNE